MFDAVVDKICALLTRKFAIVLADVACEEDSPTVVE
jgi:hypothetical protein